MHTELSEVVGVGEGKREPERHLGHHDRSGWWENAVTDKESVTSALVVLLH